MALYPTPMILILRNLKAAFKHLLKFKSHTVYSLVGLVIGLACVFIISAWTIQELRFDRFHYQSDHIYMMTTDIKDNTGNINRFPETPPPLAATLEERIPQIETGLHFLYLYGGRSIGTEEITFEEEGIAATPEFLEVFNFQLLSGVSEDLTEPNTIFLSKSLAEKLFKAENPVGQELLYKEDKVLIVNGVFKDVPRNSSIQFDFLIPYEIEYGISEEWWQLSDATIIKTSPSAEIENVHKLILEVWRESITDDQYNIGLIPITDLRYGADFEFFNVEHGHGKRNRLFMFLGVALMILVLACLNYMNLISAYAVKREYEIWVRKVHGASAGNITNYLIMESVLLSVIAWGLAFFLSLLGLRIFENLMGIVISPTYFYICTGFGLIAAILIVGLASGFYPAIRAGSSVLTKANESQKPNFMFQRNLRNAFVMSQFVLSIALAVSSLLIIRQANFMRSFDTGYAKNDIVEFYLPNDKILPEVKSWLNTHPGVEEFSFGGASPVSLTVLNTIEKWRWEGLKEGEHTSFYRLSADEEYLRVFEIPLLEGRFFSSSGSDQNKIVLNEALSGLMGFENPVGRILQKGENEYTIIGVVKDFHFQHMKHEIRPLVFTYSGSGKHLFVKIKSNAEGTVSDIREYITGLLDEPASYSFIIDEHEQLYAGEEQILSAILIFTLLSILLSSLGLIGLVTFDTEARTKEIAVRKVFGAETHEVMIDLNRNILKIFLPSVVFGCLIAWYIMQKWLEDFVNRKGLEAWVFIVGTLVIFFLALFSVSVQTWRAAQNSPAIALKNQ